MKHYFNKRAILASGFKRSDRTISLSENPNELYDKLCLIIQEKQGGNDTNRFDDEIVAKFDKLLEYKYITPTQHEILVKI